MNQIKDIKLQFEEICNISINEEVHILVLYRQEMVSIAEALGVPYHDVLVKNFFYEISVFVENSTLEKHCCYKIFQLFTCGLISRKEYYSVGCMSIFISRNMNGK